MRASGSARGKGRGKPKPSVVTSSVVRELAGVLATASVGVVSAPAGAHPRIWLDSTTLARVNTKRLASDADWTTIKGQADTYAAETPITLTVSGATNANPVEFTLVEDVPWASGTHEMYIGGATGTWTSINGVDFSTRFTATKTGTKTFTIPVDATTFGSFAGQSIAIFPYDAVRFAYQGNGWWDRLVALGLCYQALGNSPTAYGTRAVQLMDYIISLGVKGIKRPVSTDAYFATRFTLAGLAVAYDWCYDLLSSQQKSDFATAINFWYDDAAANALDWATSDHQRLQSNYFTGHVWGLGAVGLASDGDNARADEIIAAVRSKIDSYVVTGFAGHAQGGYPFESFGYGTNGYERLLYYLDALKTATGENLSDDYPQLADSLIYNLRPDRWRVGDEGDYPGSYVGVLIPSYPIVLAHVLGGTTRGGWMQHLYDTLASHAGQATPTLTRLLWYDSGGTSTNYTSTEPTVAFDEGAARLYWRSSWTDSAVWIGVNGAAQNAVGSHQARTGGHLGVQRGADYLMPYAGQWKGTTGVSGTPEQFSLVGSLANTLFHSDGGVYNFTGAAYHGGQGYWGTTTTRAFYADATNNIGYVSADLTSAYHTNDGGTGRTLNTFYRSVVTFGSGVAVVFDYLDRDSTNYTDEWWWHFNQDGTLSAASGVATAAIGTSKLFLKPLLPASVTLTVGRDWTSETDDTGAEQTHRLKVADAGTAATTMRGLTVLRAAASTEGAMPTTTLITAMGSTAYGAQTVDGSDTYTVLFSADGSTLTSVEYAA